MIKITVMATPNYTVELKSKSPVVVLPLKQYESMLEHIEDLEDQAAVILRKEEENVAWEVVEKKLNKRLNAK